ncbi:MAG: PAS domain S-box protein, partial [Rhodothermales bacterium]|nr:PAS domain S-box protein [Rhodothermales bacterium]
MPAAPPTRDELSELLAETIQDLVCLHEADGTYLWVSPSVEEVLGYTPEELVGRNPYDLIHPDDRAHVQAESHDVALEGSEPPAPQWRGLRKDGTYVWLETQTRPILDERGEVVRLQTTSRDITERRRAQEALWASQELLNDVLSSSLDGMMAFDAMRDEAGTIVDFTYRLVNPTAEQIVGRPAEELVGRRLLEVMPGNETEGLFAAYCRVVETGEPWHHEFFYDHDGIRAWFTLTAVRRSDGFAVTFRDVTAQKEAAQALRESEERFRNAFADAAIGKAIVGTDGRFVEVNPALCALVGYAEG